MTRFRLEKDMERRPYKLIRVINGHEMLWTRFLLRRKAVKFALGEAKRLGLGLSIGKGVLRRRP